MRQRPNWNEYFLSIAWAVSQRSPDEETQVGCVITDAKRRILCTGYNGFPPGFPDHELPATRPAKYPYMVHAEMNAIASTAHDLRGSILYSTHSPCADCVKAIITAGIKEIYVSQFYENADRAHIEQMLAWAGIPITVVPYQICATMRP